MGATPEEDLAAWFHSIGLATCREVNLLFPMSKRAESVRDALLAACERSDVELICCCEPVRATWRESNAVQEPRGAATAERGRMEARRPRAHAAAARPPSARCQGRAPRAPQGALRCTQALPRPVRANGRACPRRLERGRLRQLFDLPHLEESPVLCPVSARRSTTGDVPALTSSRASTASGPRPSFRSCVTASSSGGNAARCSSARTAFRAWLPSTFATGRDGRPHRGRPVSRYARAGALADAFPYARARGRRHGPARLPLVRRHARPRAREGGHLVGPPALARVVMRPRGQALGLSR